MKQWPAGTRMTLLSSKADVPYKNGPYKYVIINLVTDGSVPQRGQEGVIVAKCRAPGWYMVEYPNLAKYIAGGDTTCVAIHRVHFRRIPDPPPPTVSYLVTKNKVGQGIQVGNLWVRGVDKTPKK